MKLTLTALGILEILTNSVRLATDAQLQVMLELSGHKPVEVARLMLRLRSHEFIHRERICVGVLDLQAPLYTWSPGSRTASMSRIAWQLFVRSKELSKRPVMVNWATGRAAQLMGGMSGQLRQPLQAEHDLGTAATFIACLRRDRDAIWYGEDIVRRRFRNQIRKVPDAVIVDRNEKIQRAIEFGGQYSRNRLEVIHRYWKDRNTPWEIW